MIGESSRLALALAGIAVGAAMVLAELDRYLMKRRLQVLDGSDAGGDLREGADGRRS